MVVGAMPAQNRRKVKTGCRTCKVRKVKCDESWPICHRCKSTGRTCDGYGIWGGGSHDPNLQIDQSDNKTDGIISKTGLIKSHTGLIKPLRLATVDSSEMDCFEWFLHRSSGKLQGVFHSEAWTTLLYQASMTEPAIRHAIMALSSAHKEEVQGLGYLLSRKEYEDLQVLFTVKQYSRAIGGLEPCFRGNRRTSMHVLLICCVLFVWMDFLRGHYTKGLLHLENGLNLLQALGNASELQEPASAHVHGWLITMFTRLIVQAKLLGVSNFPCLCLLGPSLQSSVTSFRTIHHARRSLEQIMLRVFDVKEHSQQASSIAAQDFNAGLLKRQEEIQEELETWLKIYETTISKMSPRHDYIERFAYWLLRLYYHLTVILAGTCIEPVDESKYDEYQPLFVEILLQSIEIYRITHLDDAVAKADKRRDPESTSPNSISDIGWIAPLYFTAIKCRNFRIRRHAMCLLRIKPHKEGVWNATIAIFIARRVIEIEGKDFHQETSNKYDFDELDIPPLEDLQTPILPLTSRLSKIAIALPDDRAGTLCLKYCRTSGDTWSFEEYDMPDVQASIVKMVRCIKYRQRSPLVET